MRLGTLAAGCISVLAGCSVVAGLGSDYEAAPDAASPADATSPDASNPGPDAATPEPDATGPDTSPAPDAASPDDASPGPDADAATPEPDAAGPDAASPPDAAGDSGDATITPPRMDAGDSGDATITPGMEAGCPDVSNMYMQAGIYTTTPPSTECGHMAVQVWGGAGGAGLSPGGVGALVEATLPVVYPSMTVFVASGGDLSCNDPFCSSVSGGVGGALGGSSVDMLGFAASGGGGGSSEICAGCPSDAMVGQSYLCTQRLVVAGGGGGGGGGTDSMVCAGGAGGVNGYPGANCNEPMGPAVGGGGGGSQFLCGSGGATGFPMGYAGGTGVANPDGGVATGGDGFGGGGGGGGYFSGGGGAAADGGGVQFAGGGGGGSSRIDDAGTDGSYGTAPGQNGGVVIRWLP